MPRDGSGVYSYPAGGSAVSGDPISSSAYNTRFADILADLNANRPLEKGGTGASLTDPAGDRIMFYDLTASSVAWLELGTALSITGTTLNADALVPSNNLSDVDTPATARTNLGLEIGADIPAFNADTLFADEGDTLTAGFVSDDNDHGTVTTGTVTPAPGTGEENFQKLINGGAFTLAPPASSCSVILHVTNNGSAGAITTSGFTLKDGDDFTTTDTEEFLCYIVKVNDVSHLHVKALQ